MFQPVLSWSVSLPPERFNKSSYVFQINPRYFGKIVDEGVSTLYTFMWIALNPKFSTPRAVSIGATDCLFRTNTAWLTSPSCFSTLTTFQSFVGRCGLHSCNMKRMSSDALIAAGSQIRAQGLLRTSHHPGSSRDPCLFAWAPSWVGPFYLL